MYYLFVIGLFLIAVSEVYNTLLSRVRSPNVYLPRPDVIDIPEDIDDAMYEDLLQERPELKPYIKRRLPFIRSNEHDYHIVEDISDEDFEGKPILQRLSYLQENPHETLDNVPQYENQEAPYHQYDDYFDEGPYPINPNISKRLPFITRWPTLQNDTESSTEKLNASRRFFWSIYINRYFSGTFKAKCFWCGMNTSDIPRSPLCHDAFNSGDFRARTMQRFFRAYCYKSIGGVRAMRKKKWDKYPYDRSNSLARQYYGWFNGGCFKRFLDVGRVYTARGCRTQFPYNIKSWHTIGTTDYSSKRSFAAHRFAKLEFAIRKKKDACIVSPHASLTPFSRAISLYARYHVCVCNKHYCNSAINSAFSPILVIFYLIQGLVK